MCSMKKTSLYIVLIIVGSVFALSKCKPDEEPPSQPVSVGTPYQLRVPTGFPQPFIPADNPMTVEGIDLGRHLFYDKRLSGNFTKACASCHKQALGFQDGEVKALGIEGKVGHRNTMPIFNLAWQEYFFWDGRSGSLEDQSMHPITNPLEMDVDLPTVINRLSSDTLYPSLFKAAFGDSKVTKERMAKAIAQFERTIISDSSRYDMVIRLNHAGGAQFSEQEQKGYALFRANDGGDCFHCHGDVETQYLFGAFGQDLQFKNNGLKLHYTDDTGREDVTGKASDMGKFKIPSLRNLLLTYPYMHDGSIPDLDSIIKFYNTGGQENSNVDPNMQFNGKGGLKLTQDEMHDLNAFLHTLTDYTYYQNPNYSNPWKSGMNASN